MAEGLTQHGTPNTTLPTKLLVRGVIVLIILVLGIVALVEYLDRKAHEFDEPLIKALENMNNTQSYAQYVDTSTIVSERPLRVFGWYLVDHATRSYATFSTTTLQIPEGIPGAGNHDFTHDNIAIDGTVYVKVDTKSEFLRPSINDSSSWKKFTSDAIPEAYRNIAVPGPILDNLRIFANSAEYLELVRKYGIESDGDGELRHYRFKLKSKLPSESTVGALAQRIGTEGTIDMWIDDRTATIVRMLFAHDTYTSTTTLSSFNNLPRISPPPLFEE